jgi:hypothetical protein
MLKINLESLRLIGIQLHNMGMSKNDTLHIKKWCRIIRDR